jgi:hypothetical protein
MSVFYVLPPREQIGQHFEEFLASVFPGLSWPRGDWADLAEALAQAGESQPGVYVIFSDDLDESVDIEESAARDFGALRGDELIIVRPQRSAPMVAVERRRIDSRAA